MPVGPSINHLLGPPVVLAEAHVNGANEDVRDVGVLGTGVDVLREVVDDGDVAKGCVKVELSQKCYPHPLVPLRVIEGDDGGGPISSISESEIVDVDKELNTPDLINLAFALNCLLANPTLLLAACR
jgi:hypothetical protein